MIEFKFCDHLTIISNQKPFYLRHVLTSDVESLLPFPDSNSYVMFNELLPNLITSWSRIKKKKWTTVCLPIGCLPLRIRFTASRTLVGYISCMPNPMVLFIRHKSRKRDACAMRMVNRNHRLLLNTTKHYT